MKLPKKWVLAVLGSTLILASTFASGYIVENNEKEQAALGNKVDEIDRAVERSQTLVASAHTQIMVASLQLTVIKADNSQSENAQDVWRRVLVASLYESASDIKKAAGHDLSADESVKFRALQNRVLNHEDKAMSDFYHEIHILEEEAGQYREQQIKRESALEGERQSLAQFSRSSRGITLALQVIGLLMLLFKELPADFKTTV
jgi:hypothetical protein